LAQGPGARDRGHGFRGRDAPPRHPPRRSVQLGTRRATDMARYRWRDHL